MKKKKMAFFINEDGFDYYIFTPSIFKLYYNDGPREDWPKFRKTIMHKLHMLFYVLTGKYKILYMYKSGEIVSYFIFIKSRKIVKGTSKKDYYTIFYFTYPKFRGKGNGQKITYFALNKLNINYSNWYKTIDKDNYASICVSEKVGFKKISDANKKKITKKIVPVEFGTKYLYRYSNEEKMD